MARLHWLALLIGNVLLLAGCGEDDAIVAGGGSSACSPGEYAREDGTCVAAGLAPDMLCAPGEWFREDDQTCIPAGVPSDGCGEGFVHDGDRACDVLLPEGSCPLGQMAVPGETACREVTPCASGPWGDIPSELDTEYVDGSYTAGASDGSPVAPWTSIQAGVDAAEAGAIVAVAAGTYVEDVEIRNKAVRLWGKCPSLVELSGTGGEPAALVVASGASGSEVRGLTVSGQAVGLAVSGAENVSLDELWVVGNAGWGVALENTLGPTSAVLTNSLVEQNVELGVRVDHAQLTIEASVVRTTAPNAEGGLGYGISVRSTVASGASLLVERSLVERNASAGLIVLGAEATIETSVVRDTYPSAVLEGRGVNVQATPESANSASLSIARSLLVNNQGVAVHVSGSEASFEATTLRATLPSDDLLSGRGINLQADSDLGLPAMGLVMRSAVEQNHSSGIFVLGAEATIEASVVRGTQPDAQGVTGHGVSVQPHDQTGLPSKVQVAHSLLENNQGVGALVAASEATFEASLLRGAAPDAVGEYRSTLAFQEDPAGEVGATGLVTRSIVEQNHGLGVLVSASEVTFEQLVVRDTFPLAEGTYGRAVQVQSNSSSGHPASATLRGCVLERSSQVGISVIGPASIRLEASVVRETANDGLILGDGLVVWSVDGPARADVFDTRIERSQRAALSSFGGTVALSSSLLVCQKFDIGAESWQGQPSRFENGGGVFCGCPEATDPCRAQSQMLEPPLVAHD